MEPRVIGHGLDGRPKINEPGFSFLGICRVWPASVPIGPLEQGTSGIAPTIIISSDFERENSLSFWTGKKEKSRFV